MNNIPKHAFILAAGEGTRLRPYTDNVPKPLVDVSGRPILNHTLDALKKINVSHVTINLSYLGDRIEKHLQGYKEMELSLSHENELLNTGGGVKKAIDTMRNCPFYLINGDAFWTNPDDADSLFSLANDWNSDEMDILLMLQPIETMIVTNGVGDYDIDENGRAVRSLDQTGRFMFTGIRIVNPHIFENTPDDAFSFLELMDKAQDEGKLYGHVHQGEWHHISTPQELERVNAKLSNQDEVKKA